MGDREIALPRGEFVIGRSRSADLPIEDMLISRRHARLLVSSDSLFVEDLASANGVLVNEAPVSGAVKLHPGDRLMVGTHELIVICLRDPEQEAPTPPSSNTSGRVKSDTQRRAVSPIPTAQPIARVPRHEPKPQTSASHPGFDGEDTQRTERHDGIEMMGRLADRMMSLGRKDAAVRLLADHLQEVAAKVQQGRKISEQVRELLGYYGVKLTEFTGEPQWADLAVDVHIVLRRPLPERAIAIFEKGSRELPFDRQKFQIYKAQLRENGDALLPAERDLAERILRLPMR